MSSGTAIAPAPSRSIPGRLTRHLVALYFPAVSLAFLWTGPHRWWVAALFLLPMVAAHQADCAPRFETRQPDEDVPGWPFDLLVYVLAALQFLVVFELVRFFTHQGVFSVDTVMVFLVVASASGFSIVTAHELIHRKNVWEQRLGRALLCSVLYEHFYTEHIRGHHVRVGTPEDPATARFGERYENFFRRTVPAQFRSAWRLECQRLAGAAAGGSDEPLGLFDERQLGNRVLHGLLVEAGLVVGVFSFFGAASTFAFVLQAFMAVRLLEAVNYFEHWGLTRSGRRVRPQDSWDTHSWTTYYGLIGLTRHADHHAWPARPFQQLRVFEEAPLLPHGYVGSVDMVMANNSEFMEQATDELARRRLGPFAEGGEDPEDARGALARAQAALYPPKPAGAWLARWLGLPLAVRFTLVAGAFLLALSAGVQWETGGADMGFAARLLLDTWIFGAVIGAILIMRAVRDRILDHELFAFACGFVLIVAAGLLSDAVLF